MCRIRHILIILLVIFSSLAAAQDVPLLDRQDPLQLCVMAATGKALEVSALIQAGVTVDAGDDCGNTPLHYACLENHKEVVDVLLNAGARMDIKNVDGATALDRALDVADEDLILELLKQKVDPNLKDVSGRPLLCRAVSRNMSEVTDRLLSMGADINGADHAGNTALHLAVSKGFLALATALQKGGAAVDPRNKAGFTPLHYAALSQQNDVVAMLLSAKADASAATNVGVTSLHMAVRKGNAAVVERLIEAGAPVNAIAHSGDTPLYLALLNGNEATAKSLVERGAKWFTNDPVSWPRTLEALENCEAAKPTSLALPDLSVLASSKDGPELLNAILRFGKTRMADKLVKAGVDVTTVEADGITALHLAALRGDAGLCRQLLDHGAVLSALSDAGETPLSCAIRASSSETVKLFLEHDARVFTGDCVSWTSTLEAIMGASREVIALLPDWNLAELAQRKDPSELTLLYDAARRGNASITIALLSAHADPNVADKNGITPLHLAMESGNVQIAYDLIQYGADWRRKNAAGLTPADLAVRKPDVFEELSDKFVSLGKRQAQCGDMVDARQTLRGGMLIHPSGSLDCPAASWFVSTFEYGDKPIEQEALAWAEARSFNEHEKARIILALAAHYFRKDDPVRARTILEKDSEGESDLTPGIHVVHAFSLARLKLNEEAKQELKAVLAGDGHENYRLMARQLLEKDSLQVPAYSAPLAVLDRMAESAANKVRIESDLLP